MSSTIFSTKKAKEWLETLKNECIPLLHEPSSSSTSLLKETIEVLVQEIISTFNTLEDITDILSPSQCKDMDTPFLLIGNILPSLLTSLLTIFLHLANPQSEEEGEEHVSINMSSELAWRDPSGEILKRIEQIDRRIRMMGDDIVGRFRLAQRSLLTQQLEDSMCTNEGAKRKKMLEDDKLKEEIESIFKDAKLLRSSVLLSIMEATNDEQRVLYLQGLCHMLLAFKDKVCDEDKRDNNALLATLATFINGLMSVPSYIDVLGNMSKKDKEITAYIFASTVIGSAGSTFVSSSMKSKGLKRTLKDAAWGGLSYLLGGLVLLCMGLLVKERWIKIGLSIRRRRSQ